MEMKKTIAVLLFLLLGLGHLAVEAKPKLIGMKRATQIASRRVHGTIKSRELEKEHGRWIYSFDIRTGKGKITEVNVDAYTGKIIAVDVENPKREAAEERNEKKNKH
jgi:hypothetical protein